MVVGVLQGLRNARERAMYSNTVPWPMHLGAMATLAKKSFHLMNNIRSSNNTKNRLEKQCIENVRTNLQCKLAESLNFARSTNA